MKTLDFLIVGAQKCATTTLFEHLRSHPDITMPLEKELPFFTAEDCTEADWQAFARQYFPTGSDTGLWGKASPQYMCRTGTAARIRALMPDVKLVAILRDPVERTCSHYQMGLRRGTESRQAGAAIDALLQPEALARSRSLPTPMHSAGYESEGDFYVAWSEYGRILAEFLDNFPANQLLVLYTSELEADAAGTLDRLLEFIGLPRGYRPPTLGQVIHRGGGANLIPHAFRVWLRERSLLRWLWQQVPETRRARLRFQYEQWNVRRKQDQMTLPEKTLQALQTHFSRDLDMLLSLPVTPPPWRSRYLRQG